MQENTIDHSQSMQRDKTVLIYDKKESRCVISLRSSSKENSDGFKFQRTNIQLNCNLSIEKMILHDFLHNYLQEHCLKSKTSTLSIGVLRRFKSSEDKGMNGNMGLIVEIEFSGGEDHVIYLSALIRSVWQKERIQSRLTIQNIVDCCLLYMQQFQLQINDLIQVFEAPLTQQYSRL